MTLSTTINEISYTGLTGQDTFAYTFRVDQKTDMNVFLDGVAIGQGEFTMTGLGNPAGGNVVLNSILVADTIIVLQRLVPASQLVDYQPFDAFPAETHEGALDKLTMLAQQNQSSVNRSLRFPVGDNTSNILPDIAARSNLFFAFDTNGAIVMVPGTGGGVNSVSATAPLISTGGLAPNISIPNNYVLRHFLNVAILLAGDYDAQPAFLNGYNSYSDGGQGFLNWDAASTETPNNGTIFQVSGVSVGRWKRNYVGAVNIKWFGAVGDGSTDDTTAIQAALNLNEDVFIPRVVNPATDFYSVNTTLVCSANQKISGTGYGSVVRQITTNLSVFNAVSKDNISFDKIRIYAVGSRSSSFDGTGIYLVTCNFTEIKNCIVENHRGTGLLLQDCNDCKIIDNWLINSPVVAGELHSNAAEDIKLFYASSRNTVQGNHCISGQAIGISIRTINPGDSAEHNVVDGNIVTDCIGYGIMIYTQNAVDSATDNIISNNIIKNISGSMVDAGDGLLYWGTGIYIQQAENTVISDNSIYMTNINTVEDSLAPGAIGVTNTTAVTITGNTIRDPQWYGISVRDPNNLGKADGFALINANQITGSQKAAIQVVERQRVLINDNIIDNSALQGIHIANTLTADTFSIVGNTIRNCVNQGITTNFADELLIANNNVIGSGSQGIVANNGDIINISDNISKGNSGNGIQVSSLATNVSLVGNTVTSSTGGIALAAPAKLRGNKVFSNTPDWSGTFQIIRVFTSGDATPSVKDGELFKTLGSTSITDFDDGVIGQVVTLTATSNIIVVNGAPIILAGAVDYTMTLNDTLNLRMIDDQIWQEVSRSVN